METNNEVKFKISKKTRLKLLFGLVLSLLLGLILILWASNLEFGKGKIAILLIGAVSCVIFVFTGYSLYKLHKIKYIGVRLTNEGIEDMATGSQVGIIRWDDVTTIKVMSDISNLKQKYVVLVLRNPEEYIQRERTNSKKRTLKLKNDFYGSPICISTRLLDESFDILNDSICKYYSANKLSDKV
ncbi:MAG: hypothetical protein PHH81_10110 [Bacteroides graminisolvens]|nr:hypothetical protein [Bacteroides graminisolvens]